MTHGAHAEVLLVQVMLRSAQRLLGALRAEPPDVETRARAGDVLRLSFAPIWSRVPFVQLVITEAAVAWDGQPVLEPGDDGEGLLATLWHGGVRALTLVPGVEASEMHQLLLAVHRARTRHAPGDELATLLFLADLRLLGYELEQDDAAGAAAPAKHVPDGAAEPPPAPSRDVEATRDAVRRDASAEEPRRGVVELEKYDATLYFLDQREIEYLRGAIDREYARDLATSALSLLLDTFQLVPEPAVRDEVIGVLEDLLPHLLGHGRFDAVAYLIGEARKAAQDATDLRADHKEALDRLRASVSEPRAVAQLFHALDGGAVRPTPESMGVLLRELRPQAIAQVLGWAELLVDRNAKRAVGAALDAFFDEWPSALSRMLAVEEREVVQAALELAIRLKLPGFVDPLAEASDHADPSVRALVARAFSAIGTTDALRRLLGMARDEDRSVRIEVWRTFAARPHRGALRTLATAVGAKDLEDLGRREKRALFEAYGAVAGPEEVATLTTILRGKAPSGARASAHTRACAAVGLGLAGTAQARAALRSAAQDRDPVVRTAVGEALRGEG